MHFGGDLDGCEFQTLFEVFDNTLGLEKEGDMVHRGDVMDTDNLFGRDVTEHRDLVFCCGLQGLLDDYSTRNLFWLSA